MRPMSFAAKREAQRSDGGEGGGVCAGPAQAQSTARGNAFFPSGRGLWAGRAGGGAAGKGHVGLAPVSPVAAPCGVTCAAAASQAQLVDVRELWEVQTARLPGFKVYPLSGFGEW